MDKAILSALGECTGSHTKPCPLQYHLLSMFVVQRKESMRQEAATCIEAMFQWGWDIQPEDREVVTEQARNPSLSSSNSSSSLDGVESVYSPQPADLTNVVLPRDLEALGERLAELLCESSIGDRRPSVSVYREGS